MIVKIPVVTRTQDNGDGGFTTCAYNTERELLEDHPLLRYDKKLTGAERTALGKKIIEEDAPYENGYIGRGTIEVEIIPGKPDQGIRLRLAEPISFHAGQ